MSKFRRNSRAYISNIVAGGSFTTSRRSFSKLTFFAEKLGGESYFNTFTTSKVAKTLIYDFLVINFVADIKKIVI